MNAQVARELRFGRRIPEAIEALDDPWTAKTDRDGKLRQFRLVECAGDACRPQIGIVADVIFQLALDDHVRKVKPPAGAQDPVNLAKHVRLVG